MLSGQASGALQRKRGDGCGPEREGGGGGQRWTKNASATAEYNISNRWGGKSIKFINQTFKPSERGPILGLWTWWWWWGLASGLGVFARQ